MERQQSRYYKSISLFIKLAIVLLAFGFIYKQVFYRPDRDELEHTLDAIIHDPPYFLLILCTTLMLLNWGIEAWKWKLLVSKSEIISTWHALKAVLSGITIGAFTPNRFGEFAGRIFYLSKTDRIDGILMTFAGSASQLLVTIVAGCIAFVLLLTSGYIDGSGTLPYMIAGLLILITIVALLVYFNISFLVSKCARIRWLRKYETHLMLLSRYRQQELLMVFLLSSLRYMVFSFQFYLMLRIFGIDIEPGNAFIAIGLNYLVIAVVPTVALAELGIRGSAALACIGLFSDDHLGIIAASFSLWIINIALPAIAGAVFVFGLNFFKEKS